LPAGIFFGDVHFPGLLFLNLAIVEVAADTRKMSFRYSQLCWMASDAVDAVISAIPQGFKF
jgi:hypothetical protein